MAPGAPFPNTQLGEAEIRNRRIQKTPRKPTERYGTPLLPGIRHILADSCRIPQYFRLRTPLPQRPIGEGGKCETTAGKKTPRVTRNATERDGTLNFSQPTLESAVFWRVRPKFPNIFGAGQPFPQHPVGEAGNAKLPRPKRHAAEHHGTLRGMTEIIFSQSAMESAIFWRIPLNIPNIFGARHPSPTPNRGRRKMRNYRRQKTHRGTPRNATKRDRALKFSQSFLESAI